MDDMNKSVLLLGGIFMDKYVLIKNYPDRGSDALIEDEFYKVGGCPFNVAKTLKNLGLNPIIYSAVSDDVLGEIMNSYVDECGFDRACIFDKKGEKSGYCMILLDEEKERTFLTYKGCEGMFDESYIPVNVIDSVNYIYVTGIYLIYEKYDEAVITFLEKMHSLGKKIIFDPSSLVYEVDKQILDRIIKISYVITPNEDELCMIEKAINIESLIGSSNTYGIKYIAVTKGADGCEIYSDNGKCQKFSIYDAKVVDTNGTGDSFVGGFIYGLINEFSIEKTVDYASACGSLTAEFVGAHGEFKLEDVHARIVCK